MRRACTGVITHSLDEWAAGHERPVPGLPLPLPPSHLLKIASDALALDMVANVAGTLSERDTAAATAGRMLCQLCELLRSGDQPTTVDTMRNQLSQGACHTTW